ncbi:MAG: hypothetical protein NT072_09775 [Deltaproteobacteria bacterium]|nr:hypothetical protein [Deltaproteobacteria bacterium]
MKENFDLTKLSKIPAVAALLETEARKTREKRISTIAERERLLDAGEKSAADFRKRLQAAEEKIKAAADTLEKARQAWGIIDIERWTKSLERDRKLDELRADLLASYPPEIDDFIKYMDEKLYAIRLTQPYHDELVTKPHPLDDTIKNRVASSNVPSMQGASLYIRDAIQAAESMKLSAVDIDEITPRLDELKRGIPKIEIETFSAHTQYDRETKKAEWIKGERP